jgi:hypothetical protein
MTSPALEKPLRTRERAALDIARAAFRKMAQQADVMDHDEVREGAIETLARIAILLGERS